MTPKPLLAKIIRRLFAPKTHFLRFLRSGAFRKGAGPFPEATETLPDQILIDFARFVFYRFCEIVC